MKIEEIYSSVEYAKLLASIVTLNLDGIKRVFESEWMQTDKAQKMNCMSDLQDSYSVPVLLGCLEVILNDEDLHIEAMEPEEKAQYMKAKASLEEITKYCRKRLRNIGEPLDFSRYQGDFGWCLDPNDDQELREEYKGYCELDVELKLAAHSFQMDRVKMLLDFGASPLARLTDEADGDNSVYYRAACRADVQWLTVHDSLFGNIEDMNLGDALFAIVSCAAHVTLLHAIKPYMVKENGYYTRPKNKPGYKAIYGEVFTNRADDNIYIFDWNLETLEGNCQYSFGESLAKIKDVPDIPEKEIIDMFTPERIDEYREYLKHQDDCRTYCELDGGYFKLYVTTPLGEFLELHGSMSDLPSFIPESLRRQNEEREINDEE